MRMHYLFAAAAAILSASPALAQCFIGCGGGPIPVTDAVTEQNTGAIAASTADIDNQAQIIAGVEEQNIEPGLAGGFDWSRYTNASYNQSPMPGSPERNMATTLGTLQGALEAGADQQQSQAAEAARTAQLEANIAAAAGNLQMLEAIGEIDLFNGQEEIKQRNATNGQLNALLVTQSNRENKEAQDQLEGLGIATEVTEYDATNEPPGPDPQIPYQGLTE
jgi:hypothetical protein